MVSRSADDPRGPSRRAIIRRLLSIVDSMKEHGVQRNRGIQSSPLESTGAVQHLSSVFQESSAMTGKADSTTTGIRRTLLCSSPVQGLPGWETRLYLIEYPPGADGSGHHHPAVGLGYMLGGTILSAFGDDQPIAIREGESFVDAAQQVHTVSRNASETQPLRFVIAYTVRQGEPVTVLPA
jgi:quercetin dioxygenase-like cupin family protein